MHYSPSAAMASIGVPFVLLQHTLAGLVLLFAVLAVKALLPRVIAHPVAAHRRRAARSRLAEGVVPDQLV